MRAAWRSSSRRCARTSALVPATTVETAAAKMADAKANLEHTYFAWAGPTTNGSGAYFRIQGPTVFIEYAPQGKPPMSTDHIHTIYRDPTNDYASKDTSR